MQCPCASYLHAQSRRRLRQTPTEISGTLRPARHYGNPRPTLQEVGERQRCREQSLRVVRRYHLPSFTVFYDLHLLLLLIMLPFCCDGARQQSPIGAKPLRWSSLTARLRGGMSTRLEEDISFTVVDIEGPSCMVTMKRCKHAGRLWCSESLDCSFSALSCTPLPHPGARQCTSLNSGLKIS
jgi:hypothetical protein